jgi:PAS domain S-box-containing protein
MTGTGTILIVDDQLSAREVLRGLLSRQGYHLVFAASGEEALSKAAEAAPDLILLDIMMPGMDGFELCQHLRRDPELAETPVIMVTSLDDGAARLRGLEIGVADFITKPFNHAELQTRVRTIVQLNRQRRLHLQELRAERDRTQAILEALGEAVIVTDARGVVQYLNPAATLLTGFTPAEALGQNWGLWQNAETETQLYNEILKQVCAGQTWRGEVMTPHKAGRLYDAALTVAPLYDLNDQGRVTGFVSVQRDITPLKKAERAKDEFVANVSHELRTPLSVLTLVSDNLETLYERLSDDRRRKMIRDIQKHTQILNDLIGDVLEISQIDSGRISMERQVVNLAHLAEIEVEEIRLLAEQKSQHLSVEGPEQLPVWGSWAQLGQAVRNLLNNAIKYTPDQGHIRCECALLADPATTGGSEQESDWPGSRRLPAGVWAALRVVDTGIGIMEDNLPRLFERFYRVQTEQNIRGTGLGLSIARNLIELHHGHIAVASKPGQGSTFAIYLPVLEQK